MNEATININDMPAVELYDTMGGLEAIPIDSEMGAWLAMLWMGLNILALAFFILQAWGLYMINKKLWEKHAWLSFVPLLQIYNYFTASKKSFLYYLVLPIIAIIAWIFLVMFTYGISLILAYIYLFVMMVKLYHAISKRTWRWAWTTVWLIFIPFIMFPVVGYKLKANSNQTTTEEVPISEEKIEL